MSTPTSDKKNNWWIRGYNVVKSTINFNTEYNKRITEESEKELKRSWENKKKRSKKSIGTNYVPSQKIITSRRTATVKS